MCLYRSTPPEVVSKKGVLRNFAKFEGKHLCQGLFLSKVGGLLKESLAQVFSCEFCEISKNIFFTENLRTTTSALITNENKIKQKSFFR